MEVVHYKDSDFEELISFLKKSWAPQHAIYDKSLFDWQYRVHEEDPCLSLLLKDEKTIIGFLGNISSNYIVNSDLVRGAALAMWVVDEKYRTSGLGILLLKEVEKHHPVSLTLGCNLQVAPMYERMGYSYSSALNRYVLPLQAKGYMKLLKNTVDSVNIEQWTDQIHRSLKATIFSNHNINAEQLEKLFHDSISGRFALYKQRDAEFWKWRYLNSKGYHYVLFGDPFDSGVVVARIDHVYDPDNEEMHGLKVLRVIELIPRSSEVWNGKDDPGFRELIAGVLAWAEQNGCVAADFQISNHRLEKLLNDVGFRLQNPDFTPDENGLAGLFQPFRHRVNPINFVWKTRDSQGKATSVAIDDTYFVKSDGDMDRPNIWPLPTGWNIYE
ncbi:GNAT family N-acetyltransferase [Paenibacillus hunanensis]|uniref:GNAT family N-acetyltransferase n=1 Tax=Paenibacillus hunanensis TaxID=539262 RepID=UPI0020272414|nr:GNAT family N-acetyltransferase [Paenibacillus hunanensis]MCL9662464.1 GNAT family N-acetyltransferase [Paenibacillus hunanensis]